MCENGQMSKTDAEQLLKMFSGLVASMKNRDALEKELEEFGKVYADRIPDWRVRLKDVMQRENPGAEAIRFL